MPELPDLEIIREFLAARIEGVAVTSAQVRRPIVMRNLLGGDPADHLVGQRFTHVGRRGKFLLFSLENGVSMAIHAMLAGRIRYGEPLARHRVRDVLVLLLADGRELRYHDAKDMGKVYLTDDLNQIPRFATQGPEATDADLTLDVFRQRLLRRRGEIKRLLVNQTFVAGIGNAYADEICWRAGLYPFLRCASLTAGDVARLHSAVHSVLADAIESIRTRVGDSIDVQVRDFLMVHGKAGQPCPRCGTSVSEVRQARRATHFCRHCQPGLLVSRRGRH
jgi:formamidopyrimidine-DNA glycosylase